MHRKRKMLLTMATPVRVKRGEGLLSLLIIFECLACFFIWWGGLVIARGKQPEHHNLDRVEQQRRADWVRNKWEQRPWRAAMLWTIAMVVVLVVVVALTVHFGWGMKPVKV